MSRTLVRFLALPLSVAALMTACQTHPSATGATPPTGTAPATGAQVRVHGEAIYFEKMLLPEGNRLRVQVIDTQLADSPQAVIAEQVSTVGNGPYAFELDVPRQRLRAGGRYGLHASLTMPDGALRFVTDTRVPLTIGEDSTDVHIGRVRLRHVQPE